MAESLCAFFPFFSKRYSGHIFEKVRFISSGFLCSSLPLPSLIRLLLERGIMVIASDDPFEVFGVHFSS